MELLVIVAHSETCGERKAQEGPNTGQEEPTTADTAERVAAYRGKRNSLTMTRGAGGVAAM